MRFKELCEKVGKTKAIIFRLLTTALLFIVSNIIIRTLLNPNAVPWWFDVCLLLLFGIPWAIFYYYLAWIFYQKQRLEWEEETRDEEARTKGFIDTAKNLLNYHLKRMYRNEKKMNALKEKASKTSNPFLIRRYLKKKLAYECALFQVRVFSEFLNSHYRENYNLEYFKAYRDHYEINELFVPSDKEDK